MPNIKLSSDVWTTRVWDFLTLERSLALAVLSPDLIVVEVSENFKEFQEDPSLEPVGSRISELVWELVGIESSLVDLLNGRKEIIRLDNINRNNAENSTIYLSIKVIPLSSQEPGKGLLLIIEDTTATGSLEQELVQERNELWLTKNRLSQANEELEKLNRLKTIFLSIAAHDLRSPLSAISGYTDLAIKTLPQDSKTATEFLSIVLSSVGTLNRLISDFLDLNILEEGNLKIRPEPCNLNSLVREVSGVMNDIAKRKKVVLETKMRDEVPPIFADPDRIRQILFNLLGNAIKYTNEGDRVLIATDMAGDYAIFSVSDHGPGIPETEIPKLFDLYYRTEDAQQSRTKGFGLGLFIVKALVDLHNGQISVRSELGKGTGFTIRIPICTDQYGGKK